MIINENLTVENKALTLHLSSTQLIKSLLEDLPRMFGNNKIGHCALGAALLVAEKLLVS